MLLHKTLEHATRYLESLPQRHVGARATHDELRDALFGPLPENGEGEETVLDALVHGAERGIVGTAGPRYFGFVIGGALPVTVAADWMTSAWDQNTGLFATSPANSVA